MTFRINGKYTGYMAVAKRLKVSFDLTKEQFLGFAQSDCAFCESPNLDMGIARLDITKGYDVNNLIACCRACMEKNKP